MVRVRVRGCGRPFEMRITYFGVDRISDLPDTILGEILSRLPVKTVIATSVLSTRWKPLFPCSVPLTQLQLDDSDVLYLCNRRNSSDSFIDFVDKLLNVTLRQRDVQKVVLRCENKYSDVKICSWVRAALRLNVENLTLMSSMRYAADSVALFSSLHGCTTLVELVMGCDFVLELPGGFTLPNLKKLSLYDLLFRDESVSELIAGCPVLNDLRFFECDLRRLDKLYIRHPFITNLIIETCDFDDECGCRVVMDAPNVETFSHKGYCVSRYACENVESLHSLCIDFDFFRGGSDKSKYPSQCRRLAKLVKACSRTKHLCLFGNLLVALYDSCILLPTFQNLTRLTIGYMGSGGWKMLARFLEIAPSLEVLTFAKDLEFMRDYECFDSMLPSVPICLDLCLKKIEIWKFEGTPFEVKLIGYFLKNGRVLQELIVHCPPCEITSYIAELSVLPRLSEACKVLVMEGKYPGNHCFSHNS